MTTIAAYIHPNPDPVEQTPDPEPGNYYVSVLDGKRLGLLLGPFTQHVDALANVDRARVKACECDPGAHWYAFGTVRTKDGYNKPGVLNAFFPDLNLPVPTTQRGTQ